VKKMSLKRANLKFLCIMIILVWVSPSKGHVCNDKFIHIRQEGTPAPPQGWCLEGAPCEYCTPTKDWWQTVVSSDCETFEEGWYCWIMGYRLKKNHYVCRCSEAAGNVCVFERYPYLVMEPYAAVQACYKF